MTSDGWNVRQPADAELEALCLLLLRDNLQHMGLMSAGLPIDPGDWKLHNGFREQYGRWLEHSLRVLSAEALPRWDDDIACRAADRWRECRWRWQSDPLTLSKLDVLGEVAARLPDILTGKMRATALLFPGGSTERVEQMYRNDPGTAKAGRILGEELGRLVRGRLATNPTARLRILEIGAGTGATTDAVMTCLHGLGSIAEYCYTDCSHAFLAHGRHRYQGKLPLISFRLLDIERSPAEQGIDSGFDVAIAANVVHATRSIRQTLRHIGSTLRSGGSLLLNEMSGTTLFMHLTFGLLPGWWRYEDEALRLPGGPALSAASWRTVLEDEGFQGVRCNDLVPGGTAQISIAASRE